MNHRALLLLCLLLVAIGLVTSALTASARPFSPGYFVYTQADGAKIVISMAGSDERVRFARTVDGYTLLDDGKGNYVYAVKDAKGNLVKSNVKAHDLGKRGASEKTFLGKLPRNLAFSASQLAAKRPKRKRLNGPGTQALLDPYAFPTAGTNLKHLVICVDFPDQPWTRDMQNVRDSYNQQGYQSPEEGQTGSFNDFYIENSYGQLSVVTTVVGPYRMAHNHDYYGNDAGSASGYDANKPEMVLAAVEAASAHGVNFSDYDNDKNGYCDPFGIITAGYGEQGGALSDWFVICMDSYTCYGLDLFSMDGVIICGMYTVPEYRGACCSVPEAIGSPVHEFGHCLWLWDTYGGSEPMNCWDQMASGSWAGGWGDAPTHHAAYGKALLQWYTPTTISTSQSGLTLQEAVTNPECYKIETATPGEYFLLENRQQNYFDSFLPGHGMLVMHCFGDQKCYLTPADNSFACYSSEDQAGDVFPGTTFNTSFTDTTTPNAKSWADEETGKPVTNISENAGVISFDVTVQEPLYAPGNLEATPTSATTIDLAWSDNSDNETGFKIERKTGVNGTWAEIVTVATDVTSYPDTGLLPDTTYYYRVRAYSSHGNSAYSNTVNATTPPVCIAPSGLSAIAASAAQINLAWTDNSDNETGFKIERKTGVGGTFAEIATVGTNVTSYPDTGLAPETTYYYRVRAYNDIGNSTYSNVVSATTPHACAAPSGLTATAASDTRIDLTWTDNSDNENGFKIERKTGLSGTFAEVATVEADVTSYPDTGLAPSTTYYYRVRAYNIIGNSAYSNSASATTFAFAPPSGLTATVMSNTRIDLAWQDNSSCETSFRIERKVGVGGAYVQLEAVGPGPGTGGTMTYSNNGLASNVTYYYRVRAYTAGGSSACSSEAHATTYALLGPTNLTARATSPTQINLTWMDNSINETGFIIERSIGDADSWEQAGTAGLGAVSYTDAGLTPNTTYYYRVRAYNASGNSAYSNEATAATPGPPTPPSELTATAASMTQINLAWTDNSGNEAGFKIYRKKGATGTWSLVRTVAANVTSWSNTGLTYGTQYYYRVCAYNSQGASAYANEADATTLSPVANPTDLVAVAVSSRQINLTWTDNSTNETGFKIQRRKGTSTTWSTIKTVGANVTSYNNIGLSVSTLYHYRVRAYNSKGYSAYSTEADATTLPPG